MKRMTMMLIIVVAAVAAIGAGCVFPVTTTTTPAGTGWESTGGALDYVKGSINGRYATILDTFSVPADRNKYGDLYDLGYQDRTTYGVNRNLPAGYWVYSYPYWYIWKAKAGETGASLDYTKAAVNGRYETILKTFSVPADKGRYGDLYELGYQNKATYGTNRNLPTGYWVYAYPYWYIWKTNTDDTGATLDYGKASVRGKYDTILKTFSVPADKDRYGDLNDLGYQDRATYGINRNLPAGYWVYAYPYWYIWKTKTDETGASLDYGKASVRGKYETILKTFSVTADKDRYGDLYDLGYQDKATYGTNRNLPAGYWVYAYPYWYIWKTKAGDTGGTLDYTKASVKGKYDTILKTFSVPADRDRYGDLYDLGYQDTKTYGTSRNLPAGYWVYAYPYWYIWKTKAGDTEGSLDYRKASVRGKYETILTTFSVPADKDRYGDLYDLGYQDKATYGANRHLPAGYWVYAYPYWYIWEDMKGSPGPGPAPTPGPTPADQNDPSSAYGKYYNLKKEISAPLDVVTYGNYYDRGYSTDREHGSIRDLPTGYWVYVFPTWYIWEMKYDTGR
jgi:hypothetical protein